MKRRRRLRRLAPDPELIRRRAAGAPLRELASDYGVAHTTLGRYFARPEVAKQLKQAGRQLRAEQRVAAASRSAERGLERKVRRKAREQARRERAQPRRFPAASSKPRSRRWRARSPYEAWLEERDARRPLTRAELHSENDKTAARIVAVGGGLQAVIDATGLRTRENVLRLIDPALLVRAFDNEAAAESAAAAAPPQTRQRLRRLAPDPELLRRRAAGETLRRLASDYGVAHTTLSRYFARPEVASALRQLRRRLTARRAGK